MISNKKLVLYAGIAKGWTIVAEFSREPEMVETAQGCIEKTPQHHSMFSHTVKKRTYTFLVEDPFAYFAILDEDLDRAEGLWLLNRLKKAFEEKIGGGSIKDSDNLAARCFQAQMDSVFGETLSALVDPLAKGSWNASNESPANEGLKKKKKVSMVVDMIDGCREMQKNAPILFPGNERHKAKQVWKKHVWVVLMVDLFVCSILFGIWLWVCRGLQCIAIDT